VAGQAAARAGWAAAVAAAEQAAARAGWVAPTSAVRLAATAERAGAATLAVRLAAAVAAAGQAVASALSTWPLGTVGGKAEGAAVTGGGAAGTEWGAVGSLGTAASFGTWLGAVGGSVEGGAAMDGGAAGKKRGAADGWAGGAAGTERSAVGMIGNGCGVWYVVGRGRRVGGGGCGNRRMGGRQEAGRG